MATLNFFIVFNFPTCKFSFPFFFRCIAFLTEIKVQQVYWHKNQKARALNIVIIFPLSRLLLCCCFLLNFVQALKQHNFHRLPSIDLEANGHQLKSDVKVNVCVLSVVQIAQTFCSMNIFKWTITKRKRGRACHSTICKTFSFVVMR